MGNGVAVSAPGVLTGLGPGVQVDVITLLYPFSAGSEEGLQSVAKEQQDQYIGQRYEGHGNECSPDAECMCTLLTLRLAHQGRVQTGARLKLSLFQPRPA